MNKTFRGLEYTTWENPATGSLCGYVKLPAKHPFIELLKKKTYYKLFSGKKMVIYGYDKLPIECHGGLTFGTNVRKPYHDFTKGWWIGWDYAHLGDCCPKLPLRMGEKERLWSEKEVIAECKAVIKQVLDALNVC